MNNAYLVVVGTGLVPAEHISIEAQAWIERADYVAHAIPDPTTVHWLTDINPHIHHWLALSPEQEAGTGTLLNLLASGRSVCLVLAGHPAVYQRTGRTFVTTARRAGYRAWFTPAVSAEDCLFADLEVDPGRYGGQTFTATFLLLYQPVFDPTAALFLWGLDQVGRLSLPAGLVLLQEFLRQTYPDQHPLTLYTPPQGPDRPATLQSLPLENLDTACPAPDTLLYVPPRPGKAADPHVNQRLRALSTADVNDTF